jgi:hypothetical protein
MTKPYEGSDRTRIPVIFARAYPSVMGRRRLVQISEFAGHEAWGEAACHNITILGVRN